MTTLQEGELLTRVGPGTPMGAMLRAFWLPAALSSELKADGPPVRLVLLGEKLIAFRDTSGRVGIMDHRCPHRCASLFYGRNEQDGIRCIYHGWKFDVNGNCLAQPNLPPHQEFKHKVKARAYRVAERNGLVWLYMGEAETAPPLPAFEPALLPDSELRLTFAMRECNWLQAMEGDVDTSHFSFLHLGGFDPADARDDDPGRYVVVDRAPAFEFEPMRWGAMYGARRPGDPGSTYWRIAQFLYPFWTMPPTGWFEDHAVVRGWVPMDDSHTMFVSIGWTRTRSGIRLRKDGTPIPGHLSAIEFLPNTTDWYGRWRLAANASNDYRQDREMQRTRSYSGITGIHLQDQAITESMGPVTDFSFEHMAPSDIMVTQTRRLLLNAVTAHMRNGTLPPGVHDPEVARGARGGEFLAPEGRSLLESYREQLRAATDPTGSLVAAE